MAEIKTKLIHLLDTDGEDQYTITSAHSVKDVLRHLIKETSYSEVMYLLEEIKNDRDNQK